jgi:peptidoglycan glycosyltransferase
MNDLATPIRRVAKFIFILMLVLVGQLTYLQLFQADALRDDPNNVRTLINQFAKPRGDIVTADNQVVAFSEPSNDELKYQRVYPKGDLFGHITGYQSFLVGNTGVEASYNDELIGDRGEEENVPRVVLTVNAEIQQLLRDQLGSNTGSIVVMEAATGAIVGMYTNPTYDPTPIAGHDSQAVQAAYTALVENPEKPSLSRAFGERYAPGSTFKIVTAAAAIEEGIATQERSFRRQQFFLPEQTDKEINNFGGGSCGGILRMMFATSCNVTFARLATEMGDSFSPHMENFGAGGELQGDNNVGEKPPLDVSGAVGGSAPLENSFEQDKPAFALAGIGQGRVAMSPLSVALMTSAIANGGMMPTPHVVDRIEDGQGTVTKRIGTDPWRENVVSSSTASDVSFMMQEVVRMGTGTRARINSVKIAGKTGTAQRACAENDGECAPHAWFTSFAPAEAPQYIVTVFIEEAASGGNVSEQNATGGRLAAPIAKSVYEKLFGLR